jgi:hypothetical protein
MITVLKNLVEELKGEVRSFRAAGTSPGGGGGGEGHG